MYFSTCSKKKSPLFYVITYTCLYSCRGTRKEVITIDFQVTYDPNVITGVHNANVRLVYDNCKTEERYVRASNVASAIKLVSFDSHVKRPRLSYVALSIISIQLLTLRSATGAPTVKTRGTRTFTKHEWPVVTEALRIAEIN